MAAANDSLVGAYDRLVAANDNMTRWQCANNKFYTLKINLYARWCAPLKVREGSYERVDKAKRPAADAWSARGRSGNGIIALCLSSYLT
ncbi:hypothetical protein [uncultured Alloprevotella sp.]|uniref:hypothetical protein n=1 Tax=uncultured Alloprevotella sp. TaxID=1283315 RepID=UPI00260682B2|nr:hypothetical protein [uncultured Alloprevotella sp.]